VDFVLTPIDYENRDIIGCDPGFYNLMAFTQLRIKKGN
jgi:hypothetical protein